jgi:hypothetical protein
MSVTIGDFIAGIAFEEVKDVFMHPGESKKWEGREVEVKKNDE